MRFRLTEKRLCKFAADLDIFAEISAPADVPELPSPQQLGPEATHAWLQELYRVEIDSPRVTISEGAGVAHIVDVAVRLRGQSDLDRFRSRAGLLVRRNWPRAGARLSLLPNR